MKILLCLSVAVLFIEGCNCNHERQANSVSVTDSTTTHQELQQKDSVMKAAPDTTSVIKVPKTKAPEIASKSHAVYYVIGTIPELKKKGILSKKGVVASLDLDLQMKQDPNASYFTKGDMEKLHVIPINDRFYKLVTDHPKDSYRVTNNYHGFSNKSKPDSLFINDPTSFWSTSKYVVIVVYE
ncbi:MAG TPA: hypothetical protein VK806_03560 [Bacteroidia bacterium]|jgi:hypothetical protein|nr:hypothetical protein [Bacteroidia bacterium]